ncbi:MAG: ROK family protein, partial [Gemmataceae bacterium]|nr:ROK family protein [Gemmataceae bacterium]
MDTSQYYLGLDVGGTSMKAGIISADGTLIQTLLQPTNKNAGPQAGLALMEKVINLCIQKAGL